MNRSQLQKTVGRSILAVLSGFVVVVILSFGTDIVLHFVAGFPKLGEVYSDPQFMWAATYRTIYGIVGSYITASLAPNRPMKHALIGGAIGFVLAIFGAAATWNHVPSLGPHWYPVSLIIGALPTAWLGGQIRVMQMASR
jgi:hypothetical protein